MSFKNRTSIFCAIVCLVSSSVYAISVSETVDNGVKTTKTETDDGKVTETCETPSPSPMSPNPPGTGPISPGPIVGNTRLKVTEYYETLCTGSRMFFAELFKPNYLEFKDYIEFTLVPWGFAEVTSDGKIKCQHDEPECLGNKYQACALKLGKYEEDQLKYISCVMTTSGVDAYASCGRGMTNFAEIDACAKGEDGIKYSKELGELTKQAQPPLQTIPATYIEGKPLTQEEKDFMWSDFVSFMCVKLPSVKPKCCDGRPTTPPPPGPSQNRPECHPGSHCPEYCPSSSPSPMSPSPSCSPSPSPMSPSPSCSPPPSPSPIYPPPMPPTPSYSPPPPYPSMSPTPSCSPSPSPPLYHSPSPTPSCSPPPVYPPPMPPTPSYSPPPIYSPPPPYPPMSPTPSCSPSPPPPPYPPMSPTPSCSPSPPPPIYPPPPMPPTPSCSPSPLYPPPSPTPSCSPSPPPPIYPPPMPPTPSCSPTPPPIYSPPPVSPPSTCSPSPVSPSP